MPILCAGNSLAARVTDAGTSEWSFTVISFYTVAVQPGETAAFGGIRSSSLTHRARDGAGTQIWTGDHGAPVWAVAYDPDGNLYIGGERELISGGGYNYRKLNPADGSVVHSIDLGSGSIVNALSARHDYVYTGQSNFLVRQRRKDNGQAANWNYDHGAAVHAVIEDADGNIYLGGARATDVSVRKLDADGELVWSFDTGSTVRALALDESSGHLYAVGARVGTATAWKLTLAGTEVTTGWPTDHGGALWAVAVGPDGSVYVGGNRTVDITTRKYQANGTEITAGDWPLNQSSTVYGLAYLELLQTAAPGLSLPVSLGPIVSTFSHRAESGLSLPVALALPTPSAPPVPPAPDPALRAVYRLYLSAAGGSDLLELPMAALECRRRVNESTWLAVTVPSATESLIDAITARLGGEVVIYAGVATPSGETVGEFLRATFTEPSIDRGPFAGSVTLTARVIPTAFTAGSYALSQVAERGASGGRRFAVCGVDPRIRPNDTVNDGLASWTAGIIFYRIDPVTAVMRVTETL